MTTYASDGYPEGEECERCDVAADKVLAARDARAKAEGQIEGLRAFAECWPDSSTPTTSAKVRQAALKLANRLAAKAEGEEHV